MLAAWLAQRGLLDIRWVLVVVVLADLVGDSLLYLLGRTSPSAFPLWFRRRVLPDRARVVAVARHFRDRGGRTLVVAKLTHVAGLPVLMAAGATRMPFWSFLAWNLVGTIPKSLVFAALGWSFGAAWQSIDGLIWKGSLVMLLLLAIAGGAIYLRRRAR